LCHPINTTSQQHRLVCFPSISRSIGFVEGLGMVNAIGTGWVVMGCAVLRVCESKTSDMTRCAVSKRSSYRYSYGSFWNVHSSCPLCQWHIDIHDLHIAVSGHVQFSCGGSCPRDGGSSKCSQKCHRRLEDGQFAQCLTSYGGISSRGVGSVSYSPAWP
jgi:hypothetical protein